MSDRLARGLLPTGLRAIHVRVTETARIARMLHGLYPTAARLFSEALAAALLVASLQKERSRVNLQVECDGPIRGLFVDADPDGHVRGYVRAPQVHFPGDPAAGAHAALGGTGFLSILRDLGEANFYRGSVELRAFTLAGDLERYFTDSEQVATAVALAVLPRGDEPLGDVCGLLVQRLPDGDDGAIAEIRARTAAGAFREATSRGATAHEAIQAVTGMALEPLADLEVGYHCGCSFERARNAVSALGHEGLLDVLAHEREAVITCEFCRSRYVVEEADLRRMADQLRARDER